MYNTLPFKLDTSTVFTFQTYRSWLEVIFSTVQKSSEKNRDGCDKYLKKEILRKGELFLRKY